MKTVLLTGANGLLGQKLVELLAGDPGYRLVATSRGDNRNLIRSGYEYESLDITNKERLSELFDQYQPDVVINSAAMTHVDKCEQDKEACIAINVTAVRLIAELCQEYKTKLVHVSTDFIFDGAEGPYDEEAKPNPLSFYGQSKLDAEKIVMDAGIPYAIARTILIYGVVSDMSRSNIVLWAKGALEKGDPIKVVNDQFRSPTLAEDLAVGIRLILEKDAEGIYNLSGGEQMCITDIVRGVADFWQLDASDMSEISSAELNQPAKRPPVTGFILDKANRELGYQPHTFAEGLAVVDQQLKLLQS